MKNVWAVFLLLCSFFMVSCGKENHMGYWESAYAESENELVEAARVLTVEIMEDGSATFAFTKNASLKTKWIEKDGFVYIDPDRNNYQAWIDGKMLVIDVHDREMKLYLVRDLNHFTFPPNIQKGLRIE
ncbi:MAG: hypothetical protein Q4A41_03630 [Bacillota bacterium]|nr:hypothetical protein [Bacillota bacterium]